MSYGYDAPGREVSQTSGGATTNELWDEESPNGDVVLETDAGSGAVQSSYALDGQGTLLAQTRGGTTSYALPDGQGSVRALADSGGAIIDRYSYDAFGNLTSSQGTTAMPYGYDGQRLDASTGLYQLRARDYDPTTGRFLSRDTRVAAYDAPELDRYVYGEDNPVNAGDPTGHQAASLTAGARPTGGSGPIGEYVSLLLVALVVAPAVAAVGQETRCLTMRGASILMAAAHDGPGLLWLKALDPSEPSQCIIPVLVYPRTSSRGKDTHNVHDHIQDAQARRGSVPIALNMLLSRDADAADANLNRRVACRGFVAPPPPNTSCDEYPFAATYQGGQYGPTSVCGVPFPEQRVQGGIVSAFYRDNAVGDGDLFACVPEP